MIANEDIVSKLKQLIEEYAESRHVHGCALYNIETRQKQVEIETLLDKIKFRVNVSDVAFRFVDRAGDVHPGIDDAETICRQFAQAMNDVCDRYWNSMK